MVFYYFLPRIAKETVQIGDELSPAVLAEHGLAEILADVRRVPAHAAVSYVHNSNGPGGQPGTIITPVSKHNGAGLIGNLPDRQTWVAVGDGKKLWVGALTKSPPSPLDLERWQTIGGYRVADPQSYEWLVPVARAPQMQFGTLPQSFTFGPAGEVIPNLQPQYQWLWELGRDIRDWYVAESGPSKEATPAEQAAHVRLPFTWLVREAARILGVNYRVGLAELNLLHTLGRSVLTQSTVHAICQTVYGWEVFEEAKKNETAEEESTAPSS